MGIRAKLQQKNLEYQNKRTKRQPENKRNISLTLSFTLYLISWFTLILVIIAKKG